PERNSERIVDREAVQPKWCLPTESERLKELSSPPQERHRWLLRKRRRLALQPLVADANGFRLTGAHVEFVNFEDRPVDSHQRSILAVLIGVAGIGPARDVLHKSAVNEEGMPSISQFHSERIFRTG